jgi:hypothetical protein
MHRQLDTLCPPRFNDVFGRRSRMEGLAQGLVYSKKNVCPIGKIFAIAATPNQSGN